MPSMTPGLPDVASDPDGMDQLEAKMMVLGGSEVIGLQLFREGLLRMLVANLVRVAKYRSEIVCL